VSEGIQTQASIEQSVRPAPRKVARSRTRLPRLAWFALSVLIGIGIWQLVSMNYDAVFMPSPPETWDAAVELARDGTLSDSIIASMRRILIGWAVGVIVGVPIGLLMGRFGFVGRLLDPYIQFFRFIPPIAFVTLAVVWLGAGESAKIVLIVYTTVFIVIINTIAGVLAIDEVRLRAAASLGANRTQTMFSVIVPATLPYIITGSRLAMGNSFLTIVSAEIVAAQSGLGALIWTSRNFGRTDWVFVGIITLGILGFLTDLTIRWITRTFLGRYGART
jgi:ABC-type nitrate/sulfonate/bicarbonate transport system permease component